MNKFEEYISSELPIKNELLQIFRKEQPRIIFDIGACEGEDSIRYSKLFSSAIIYSFEPLPENFEKCKKNFSKYPDRKINPYQYALSSTNGYAKFFVSSGNPDGVNLTDWDYGNKSSSLYPPNKSFKTFEWLRFEKEINVETKTISSFCEMKLISKIDFIHMDVQGAEVDVLKGANDLIYKINAIWLEVETVSMYEGQPLKKDVENFMRKAGFIKILDTAFGESGDQLYINNRYNSNFDFFIIKSKIIILLKEIYFILLTLKKKIS